MAVPNLFQKNLGGNPDTSALDSAIGAVPSLLGGYQLVKFLFDAEGGMRTPPGLKSGAAGSLALAEIVAKSTLFKGRFIDDIFVLLFTRPSSLGRMVGEQGLGLVPPVIRGVRLNTIAATFPNFFAFVFRLNPSVHQRTQTRARNTMLTKGGYLTHYWSSGMKVMTFNGNSGPLVPPERTFDKESFNIRQTVQYANFLQLRRFYEQANQDVALFFMGRFLQGVLSEFSFTEDADDPYQIKYTFKFEAYPEQQEIS